MSEFRPYKLRYARDTGSGSLEATVLAGDDSEAVQIATHRLKGDPDTVSIAVMIGEIEVATVRRLN